jgi:hypothetical protein
MGYHYSGLQATCDTKGCAGIIALNNDEGLPGALLTNMAIEAGWLIPLGGGKTLCPRCRIAAEVKYKAKLSQDMAVKLPAVLHPTVQGVDV